LMVDGMQIALTVEKLDEEPETLLMPPQAASVIKRQDMTERQREGVRGSAARWRTEFAIALYLYSNCGQHAIFGMWRKHNLKAG
jgi:hypothetical protein